jgi:hypothetical protein
MVATPLLIWLDSLHYEEITMPNNELPAIPGNETENWNQCEIRCPFARTLGRVATQALPKLNIMQKAQLIAEFGPIGTGIQIGANTLCPYRNKLPEDWRPSDYCANQSAQLVNKVGRWVTLPTELTSGAEPASLSEGFIEIDPDNEAPQA